MLKGNAIKPNKRQVKVKQNSWLLGFLGFLGISGFFHTDLAYTFLFFSFFGFFGLYWEYKLDQQIQDERLIQNRYKASNKSYRIGFSIVWMGIILLNSTIPKIIPAMKNIEYQYSSVLLLIGLSFALVIILSSYLAYKYDN